MFVKLTARIPLQVSQLVSQSQLDSHPMVLQDQIIDDLKFRFVKLLTEHNLEAIKNRLLSLESQAASPDGLTIKPFDSENKFKEIYKLLDDISESIKVHVRTSTEIVEDDSEI